MRGSAKFIGAAVLAGVLGALAPYDARAQGAPPVDAAPSAASTAKAAADPRSAAHAEPAKPAADAKALATAIPAGATTAKPAAAAKGALGKDDKAAGGAGAQADAKGAASGALPPGHPPMEAGGMPAGHPAVSPDDDDDDEAPANPHGGGGMRDPRLFKAPPDEAEDDPTLPTGTIVVTLKNAQGAPMPRTPVTIGILHSSVARGDTSERKAGETDESGVLRFDGLASGSGTSYRVSTARDGATYALPPFALGDQAGKRAVLHSYDSSTSIAMLPIGMQAVVFLSLREDSIQVQQYLNVFNLGAVSWVADAPFELPAGFRAFNKQEAAEDARVDEVKDKGAALRGTFSPGRHDIAFQYQLPLAGAETQVIKLELPPHIAQARVIAEASRAMTLNVSGFPETQTARREGKRLLITERTLTRSESGVPMLTITLGGLPTEGPGRYLALSLAVVALLGGISYAFSKRFDTRHDPEARADLAEAREALLDELVALERARKSGEVGPKTYDRVRRALLDSLSRIVSMLDEIKAQDQRGRRVGERAPETAS